MLADGCHGDMIWMPERSRERASPKGLWPAVNSVIMLGTSYAPPLDPLPVMQQFETFEYSAQTLRDPFSTAFAPGSSAAGPRPDDGRPKQALEQFPLDSLKMVGTIGTRGSLVALVMGPDKVTQRVVPGNYMGQSDGRVTGVYEDRIELVELVSDGAGGWLERPATVSLDDE